MYNYEYVIYKQSNSNIFKKQCELIEKKVTGVEKEGGLLEDVDGSLLQKYKLEGKEILVLSDVEIGYVVVKSEFDLQPFFQ